MQIKVFFNCLLHNRQIMTLLRGSGEIAGQRLFRAQIRMEYRGRNYRVFPGEGEPENPIRGRRRGKGVNCKYRNFRLRARIERPCPLPVL